MSDEVDSTTAGRPAGRARPVRTCVGCRERAAGTDLLRVVVGESEGRAVLVLDLRGGLPGRGAHLHPRSECLGQAERRRAFPRALRVPGPLDTRALHDHLAALGAAPQHTPSGDDDARRRPTATTGSEQGMSLR